MTELNAIETESLLFLPNAPKTFLALIDGKENFSQTTGYEPADGLRAFITGDDVSPEFIASLKEGGDPNPWKWGFLVIHKQTKLAIGTAGFKGPPDKDGTVEIAYGIVPVFENQGYATMSARTLVDFASKDSRVKIIWAHTLPEENASTRVLEKNGFMKSGPVHDPEDGEVWRWQLGRTS